MFLSVNEQSRSVGIAGLRQAMADYAAGFDPALITAAEADRVVSEASAIANMANTVCALAAARVASTSLWRSGGDRSAAHRLARTAGVSVGVALATIETGRRLDCAPVVAAAARRGELSVAQSAAITGATTSSVSPTDPVTTVADVSAQQRLVATASSSSLSELQSACAQTRAGSHSDGELRRQRIHHGRFLRSYTDSDGAWNLRMRDNPEVGAQIMVALAPFRDQLFAHARSEGRREPAEAYGADALLAMATESMVKARSHRGNSKVNGQSEDRPAGADRAIGVDPASPRTGEARTGEASSLSGHRPRGSVTKIIARVDLGALLRGHPVGDEVCELVGFGPVAVSAVRDLMDTGDPFLSAVVTKGVDVVGVAHLGRRANVHQQTALEWLYPTCAAEGCSATVRLENDHRLDWADSHTTVVDLLDRLCSHHHDLKTYQGWSLVPGRAKRPFVGPGDPSHPGRAEPASQSPPANQSRPAGEPSPVAAANDPPEAARVIWVRRSRSEDCLGL